MTCNCIRCEDCKKYDKIFLWISLWIISSFILMFGILLIRDYQWEKACISRGYATYEKETFKFKRNY